MLYHTTSKENIQKIRQQGFNSRQTPPPYYSRRYNIDMVSDTVMNEFSSNWANRRNGVYFWNTEQLAHEKKYDDDVVLCVDETKIDTPLWCLSTDEWEQLYRRVGRIGELSPSDEEWKEIKRIIQTSERYQNQPGKLEVWTAAPVSSDSIVSVMD